MVDEETRILGIAVKTWSERAKCDYTTVPFGPRQVGFIILPKHSPYYKIISIGLVAIGSLCRRSSHMFMFSEFTSKLNAELITEILK